MNITQIKLCKKYVFYIIFNLYYYIMDSNNFVAYYDGKKIISGGYIINDMNIVSSLVGGTNISNDKNIFDSDDEYIITNDDEDSKKNNDANKNKPLYAIPAGLITNELNNKPSTNVDINYSPKDVLNDEVFDNLYDSIIIGNENNKEKMKYKNKKNNKKTKKSKNKIIKINSKKTKSHKK